MSAKVLALDVETRTSRQDLSVMVFFLIDIIGSFAESNPLRIGCAPNSGNRVATSSSRLKRPCSTAWSAATADISFDCDAIASTASSVISGASASAEVLPTAELYLKLPKQILWLEHYRFKP